MANQSKSMIFGFVIIAAIIFAVALGYKITQKESLEKPPMKPTIEKTANLENEVQEIKVISYDEQAADMRVMPTPEEQAETAARAPHFMKFAMSFQNGEEALKALPTYIENGKLEEAHFLVKFIETQFPDTQIPEEFADL